ncbi:MAG: polysaccharide biosynthesis/export family protein [Duncaniella sp.]|mgnify:CR=1 FL=1|nr:polysaccharide biosynthesis/export family protein [Duncaniella sp.]MDE5918219.1 polysaccharide biosynthesis/export family protein [Duncaniella sp.]MDE6327739.1 polysaccharide biosynthesis/export family protein [Duncaniella sp.]MDE6357964.1 polysaccharide biosynthesis/export family protein [Duncaniella sp.]MDE6466966.1 polysaccharide biosynthesis/export family protein [Duncaniella sp.]
MKTIITRSLYKTTAAIIIGLAGAIATSCGPAQDIVYMQDLPADAKLKIQTDGELRLCPGDRLYIEIHSRDKELAEMFNLSRTANGATGVTLKDAAYTVDKAGNIDMPILGQIRVDGLTRLEVAQLVKYRLLSGNLLRDPIVTVSCPDMAFYVIGESGVGRHAFPDDKLNILEALSISGDLAISGKRTNVLVLRTEDDKQVPYRVDLTNTDAVYASPVFYIRQNDMIYVEPNQVKANTSTANGSNYMTLGFWTSLLSLGTTIAVLVTK